MADNKGFAGATISVTQTVALWSIMMPPVHELTVHTPGRDPAFANNVRQAEIVVATASIAVGALMAKIENSSLPLLASIVLTATLIGAYEYTLRKDPGTPPLASVSNI